MYFDRKKYKEFAFIQLKSRLRIPMIMIIIYMAIQRLVFLPEDFMPNFFNDLSNYIRSLELPEQFNVDFIINSLPDYYNSFAVSLICRTVSTLLVFILSMATNTVYLEMTKTPEAVPFKSFLSGFKKWYIGLGTGLWRALWIFIWMIPAFIISTIVGVLVFFASDYMKFFIWSTGMIAISFATIPALAKNYAYSFAMYIACEFKGISPAKALNLSTRITRNHLMDLFVLNLSFIGWILLVSLTRGIAGLWVMPYMTLTEINAYHALLKAAVEKGTVTMAELGMDNTEKPELPDEEETSI